MVLIQHCFPNYLFFFQMDEINGIEFYVMSAEDILRQSVCEVTVCKLPNTNDNLTGTVYDRRMGTLLDDGVCETCDKNTVGCQGHFGHITLNHPIIHPLFYKQVVQLFRCFCQTCVKLLITKDYLQLYNLVGAHPLKIYKRIQQIQICCHCGALQKDVKASPCDGCLFYNTVSDEDEVRERVRTPVNINDVLHVFSSITSEEMALLNIKTPPINYILKVFPVIPPISRPYVISEGTEETSDDDLTIQLIEILKTNIALSGSGFKNIADAAAVILSLNTKIATYISGAVITKSKLGIVPPKTNVIRTRPIKSVKERLVSKTGLIRMHLMGKRVNYSGRTVIGPDATLRLGEIAVPEEMAATLTIPVVVNRLNYKECSDLIKENKVATILDAESGKPTTLKFYSLNPGTRPKLGDTILSDGHNDVVNLNPKRLLQPGERIMRQNTLIPVTYPSARLYPLKIGDTIERYIRDGDVVLLNRQPTLHKGSMQAKTIRIRPGRTIRMNLACTKPFNADFDGDEMHIHVPQSLEAQTELRELSASKHHLLSSQSGKPNMAIVQDCLLGAWKMTLLRSRLLTHTEFCQILMAIPNIQIPTHGLKKKARHSRKLVKYILPKNFYYTNKNNADRDEETLVIKRGKIQSGAFDKNALGACHHSILFYLVKEYSVDVCVEFISNIQFLANAYLLVVGFSVGLDDCLVNLSEKERISAAIEKCFIEADGVLALNAQIQEYRISAALNKAKDLGHLIAKRALKPENNFVATVTAGSKGDYFNILSITGLCSQQNLMGKRVPKTLSGGTRTLPHYGLRMNVSDRYVSRGFVKSSFIGGLSPQEFIFHSMSGREGVVSTSLGTPNTGYVQRKIVKLTEDIHTHYDGTVRDSLGRIYQFSYGGLGLDPAFLLKKDDTYRIADVKRIVKNLRKT